MRNPCLDEGILQSYTDGELEPQMLEQVVSHLATCAACTEAASLIESEMEFTNAAFAHEMNLSVPTERLRARIDEAVAGLHTQPAVVGQSAGSRLGQWLASFVPSLNFAPQRALGFASLAVFFVLATIIGGIVMRERNSQTGFVAAVNVNQKEQGDLSFTGPKVLEEPTVVETTQQPAVRRRAAAKERAGASDVNQTAAAGNMQAHHVLPGEKNYLQAISVLSEAIEANGESSLKPTLLADYKRNLAVVDQAITATQRTARTNPKSTDAAEMLYAAYQSKLDLLSAVAEQSKPLVAQR